MNGMNGDNRWAQFDRTRIAELARCQPTALDRLGDVDVDLAVALLERTHAQLFVPTEQVVDVLERLVGLARTHCSTTYTDPAAFAAGCHSRQPPTAANGQLVCLTGLGGVGKSALLARVAAILREIAPRSIACAGVGEFACVPAWRLLIGNSRSEREVLNALHLQAIESELDVEDASAENRVLPTPPVSIAGILDECRRRGYRNQVGALLVDEMQFMTRSASANTLVTSLLLHLRSIGVPCVFAANYSLGHRLLRRNHEDTDRIFEVAPIVLLPEPMDSSDWVEAVKGFVAISPQVFDLDVDEHAQRIHGFCFGINRYLGRLIRVAYRRARKAKGCITIGTLQEAYDSNDFAYERRQVVELQRISLGVVGAGRDLVCPFELPANETRLRNEQVKGQRGEEIVAFLARQQLTQSERGTLDELNRVAADKRPAARVRSIRPDGRKLTVESLRANEQGRGE